MLPTITEPRIPVQIHSCAALVIPQQVLYQGQGTEMATGYTPRLRHANTHENSPVKCLPGALDLPYT